MLHVRSFFAGLTRRKKDEKIFPFTTISLFLFAFCPDSFAPDSSPHSDRDGDGVVDTIDNCPDHPNPLNRDCRRRHLLVNGPDQKVMGHQNFPLKKRPFCAIAGIPMSP